MVKGLQAVDGKWYIMDESGKMLIKPLVLTLIRIAHCNLQACLNKSN